MLDMLIKVIFSVKVYFVGFDVFSEKKIQLHQNRKISPAILDAYEENN